MPLNKPSIPLSEEAQRHLEEIFGPIVGTSNEGPITAQEAFETIPHYKEFAKWSLFHKLKAQPKKWLAENEELGKKAAGGDDEAFFELVGREPRYIQCDYALYRIATWQRDIENFYQFNHLHAEAAPESAALANFLRLRMEYARRCLERVGISLIPDFRGMKRGLRDDIAWGAYCAFYSLCWTLREIFNEGKGSKRSIMEVLSEMRSLAEPSGMMIHYCWAVRRLGELEGLTEATVEDLLLGQSPSVLAREYAARALGVSVTTLRKAVDRPTSGLIFWPEASGKLRGLSAKPPFDLRKEPQFRKILKRCSRK